ncbi:hybrid sensor histidine kinase/response regulator transcription factor [Paenibacillus sp. UNC499MF]|uniref:helix-turn-helix transcriptional regulator n=1 Tax=Paenibacillus sp. UNC499MF TaxID=1502751 RepID=UPI0008A020F7|nr:hybrid sensor histidine kinase/response regulator transcription factor [Paenibacillus sp. UNC499MF]SEG49933.1 DNA-binding response regulator, NarL/FixJ family, contains REC and HTH domains [Paenibacillus sp. UNC499MF]
MFDAVKQWFWYEWALFIIRLLIFISTTITTIQVQNDLNLPLWLVLCWEISAFSVPWILLQVNTTAYLIPELILSGGVSVYLTSLFPEAYLTFLVPAALIAANSEDKTYRWTGPAAVLLVPFMMYQFSEAAKPLWEMMVQIGLAYAIGYAFHLLVVNYRQNEIIRSQNSVLEQYMSQVERMTLLEERNRLAKDLHDTMGHSYTSLIMGLETLRPDIATEEGENKLEALLAVTRKSMGDVREFLHEMGASQKLSSLREELERLGREFEASAGVTVRLRVLGEEEALPQQVKMIFYRCLQEALTNAVRHGRATEVQAALQFEPRQIRLEVQDNGEGSELLTEGFGLKAMKERAASLQGQVSVYSEKGAGTTVTCTLPRQVEPGGEMIRLLIADDQAFIRESLRTILEGQKDMTVTGLAGDGEQAVELCAELEPDLVLMDLDMPNMDGTAATRTIKQKWPHVRVVILTTFQAPDKALEVLRSGADGYLFKSIEPKELAETIRLVHRGGTMIAQDLSTRLFGELGEAAEASVRTGASGTSETPGLPEAAAPAGAAYDLTPREIEILRMLSKGLRYKSIASKLYLSDGTVRNYASTVYAKLGVRNREDAVEKAAEAGLL